MSKIAERRDRFPPGKRTVAELAGRSSAGTLIAPAQSDIFKTGSIVSGRTADSLTVSGAIHGRSSHIVVDTGSNISIVRPDVLPKQLQDSVKPVTQCGSVAVWQ